MRAVFATSLEKPALTVVKQVCNSQHKATTTHTSWGVKHEMDALKAALKSRDPHHTNLKAE